MLKTYLVTDRTSQDVERWRNLRDKGWVDMTEEERSEWLSETPTSATKGMYTYRDLNRVEGVVEILSNRLRILGYLESDLSVKTDWTYKDAFWRTDMERYLKNISAIRGCLRGKWDTPVAPNITDKFDYDTANVIEKILIDVDEVSTKLTKSWHYSGEVISGEV